MEIRESRDTYRPINYMKYLLRLDHTCSFLLLALPS